LSDICTFVKVHAVKSYSVDVLGVTTLLIQLELVFTTLNR